MTMLKKTLICILLVGSVHFAMAESLNDALNRSRSGNSNNNRPQVEDLFTGDVKLACEATLCLSTGNRPSECQPAIHRYFSIRHKRMGDTIRARHNFLRLCPGTEPYQPFHLYQACLGRIKTAWRLARGQSPLYP